MTRGGWIVIVGLVCLLGVGSFALMRMLEPETLSATAESLDAPRGVTAKSSTVVELETAAEALAKTAAREAPESATRASAEAVVASGATARVTLRYGAPR